VPVVVVDEGQNQPEAELDGDPITEPGKEPVLRNVSGSERDVDPEAASAQNSGTPSRNGHRASGGIKESKRGGGRRSRRIPPTQAPSANVRPASAPYDTFVPHEDTLNFEF
jgi:hypothetical protein